MWELGVERVWLLGGGESVGVRDLGGGESVGVRGWRECGSRDGESMGVRGWRECGS